MRRRRRSIRSARQQLYAQGAPASWSSTTAPSMPLYQQMDHLRREQAREASRRSRRSSSWAPGCAWPTRSAERAAPVGADPAPHPAGRGLLVPAGGLSPAGPHPPPGLAGALESDDDLDVPGVREHVDGLDRRQAVPGRAAGSRDPARAWRGCTTRTRSAARPARRGSGGPSGGSRRGAGRRRPRRPTRPAPRSPSAPGALLRREYQFVVPFASTLRAAFLDRGPGQARSRRRPAPGAPRGD